MTDPAPRAALVHPSVAAPLVAILPALAASRWRADIVLLCLLWVGFCQLWGARWFGPGRPDGAGADGLRASISRGAAVTIGAGLGAVAIAFLRAWDLWILLALLPAPALILDHASLRLGGRLHRHYARAPIVSVTACLALTLGAYGSIAMRTGAPSISDDFLYPLRAPAAPPPLSEAERSAAVSVVRAALTGAPRPTGLPEGLLAKRTHRAFVTLFRPTRKDRWTRGEAAPAPLADQLEAAARAAVQRARGRGWREALPGARIQIDLEGRPRRLGARWARVALEAVVSGVSRGTAPWRFLQYDNEAGVDGFTLREGETTATVLPADPLLDGWYTPRSKRTRYRVDNWERLDDALRKRGGFERGGPWPAGATLHRFRTHSFAEPDPAEPGRTVALYRGNVLFEGELDEARLLGGIAAAGEWLLGTVEADGRFDYEYFPSRDDHGRGYNEVRHAGSVYGLFHLAELAAREATLSPRRDAYIEAGVRALDRVYGLLGTPPGVQASDGYVAFLEGKGGKDTNSGAQALSLLSFLQRPAPDTVTDPTLAAALTRQGDDAVIAGLAKTLMAMVDDRGWVHRTWTEARSGTPMRKQPLYFPGEALLALVRYHEHTGDAAALATAKRVGRAQIEYTKRPFEIPDHWVMQALDHLDTLDPGEPAWRAAAYWMGADYIDEQFPPQVPHAPDYRGAYRRDMEIARTTRAASRGEAIGGVARIAWRRGDPAGRWERSLIEGARHLMEQQYTPDNTFHFPVPAETWGAIRMGLIDNHCRIDNNQHAIVALDNALEALRRRETR